MICDSDGIYMSFGCYNLNYRPTADQVETRLKAVCLKEGLDVKPNVIRNLVEGSQADIRQILNTLSTYRLKSNVLTYDGSKAL